MTSIPLSLTWHSEESLLWLGLHFHINHLIVLFTYKFCLKPWRHKHYGTKRQFRKSPAILLDETLIKMSQVDTWSKMGLNFTTPFKEIVPCAIDASLLIWHRCVPWSLETLKLQWIFFWNTQNRITTCLISMKITALRKFWSSRIVIKILTVSQVVKTEVPCQVSSMWTVCQLFAERWGEVFILLPCLQRKANTSATILLLYPLRSLNPFPLEIQTENTAPSSPG